MYLKVSEKVMAEAMRAVLGIKGIQRIQLKGKEGYGEAMGGSRVSGGVMTWWELGNDAVKQARIVYSLPVEEGAEAGYIRKSPVRRETLKLEIEDALSGYGIFVREWQVGWDVCVPDNERWLEVVFDGVREAKPLNDAGIGFCLLDVAGLASVQLIGPNGERLPIKDEDGELNQYEIESWAVSEIIAECDYVQREPLAIWEEVVWIFDKFEYIAVLVKECYDAGAKTGTWRFVVLDKEI